MSRLTVCKELWDSFLLSFNSHNSLRRWAWDFHLTGGNRGLSTLSTALPRGSLFSNLAPLLTTCFKGSVTVRG